MSGTAGGSPLRIVVTVAEALTAVAVVVFVVMLFVNEPADPEGGAAAGGGEGAEAGVVDGATVFVENCASCHGPEGEGGAGPALAGGAVVEAFPDAADQVELVTNGRGGMPAFGEDLSPEEIEAVVEHTRGL